MSRAHLRDICIGVVILILPFLIPLFFLSESLVGASLAVFSIVAGFFIADAMANYLRLQTLISEENASLISLASEVKNIDAENYQKVHQAIDEYMISQLDYGDLNHILHTQDNVENIGRAIQQLKIDTGDGTSYGHVLGIQEKIFAARQEISLAAQKNLSVEHWVTLGTLATSVAVTVLSMRDGSFFMNFIAGIMMVGVWAIIVLLRDMDNNRLLENKLAFKNPREVFHAISRPPYYPVFSSPRVRIPNEQGILRVGT